MQGFGAFRPVPWRASKDRVDKRDARFRGRTIGAIPPGDQTYCQLWFS